MPASNLNTAAIGLFKDKPTVSGISGQEKVSGSILTLPQQNLGVFVFTLYRQKYFRHFFGLQLLRRSCLPLLWST